MTEKINQMKILGQLLELAKRQGADSADAILFNATSIEVAQRLGKPEKLERSETADLGLRVFVGKCQAIVSSTDFSDNALKGIVERSVAMAKAAPEDPWCGIAEPNQISTDLVDLDIHDPLEPTTESLIEKVSEAEDAGRGVPGVTNSEGAEAGWSNAQVALATSNGFAQNYSLSSHSISVSVLAGKGTDMERDYDFATAVHAEDLPKPFKIGLNAGKRAVKRLNPKKKKTAQVPIVFDWRISSSLLRHLTGAINGAAIARGTSFLKDFMGKEIFDSSINIYEDPLRKRGLLSKPFDGEAIATKPKLLVKDGKLLTWLMDLSASRQLHLLTTGNAARGTGGPPSPAATNVYMEAGSRTVTDLLSDIENGFLVTELIGMGVNSITGDYSRGASGFWIEKGEIAYPVSEMTIAGNLKQMFSALTPANDLKFRFGTDAPTLRIDGMTTAGI